MFIVSRVIDHGCNECGGVQLEHIFATANGVLAKDWVEAATIELEVARTVVFNKHTPPINTDNTPNPINRDNWQALLKEVANLDSKGIQANASSLYDVEYQVAEVEVRG